MLTIWTLSCPDNIWWAIIMIDGGWSKLVLKQYCMNHLTLTKWNMNPWCCTTWTICQWKSKTCGGRLQAGPRTCPKNLCSQILFKKDLYQRVLNTNTEIHQKAYSKYNKICNQVNDLCICCIRNCHICVLRERVWVAERDTNVPAGFLQFRKNIG